MTDALFGKILQGDAAALQAPWNEFSALPVDEDRSGTEPLPIRSKARTIAEPVEVSGPGTFFGSATRTLRFEPTTMSGWWFDRTDHPDCLPVKVSIRNVWNTGAIVSNIVLRSGPPQNYIRLVEHIIALRMGYDIDNLLIRIDSGDPPLFNAGSLDLVDALQAAGRKTLDQPVPYLTVKEKVTFAGSRGDFLVLEPMDPARPALDLDVGVHFKTAIGRQRIRFPVNEENFTYGSVARTNTSATKKLYCQTIGRLFADVRNLGYTKDNVLIAGRFGYVNQPRLAHKEKALEAVWHRAVLDLLAAIALIENGRFLGKITSYKAGHRLDVECVRALYRDNLLVPVSPAPTEEE